MADIAVTAKSVAVTQPKWAEIYDFLFDPAAAVTVGQTVYLTTAGLVATSDANGSGTTQAIGIVVNIRGRAASVCRKGFIAGFTVSGMAYGASIFTSNTAGSVADAAGAIAAVVGRVMCAPDSTKTKIAYFDFPWATALA